MNNQNYGHPFSSHDYPIILFDSQCHICDGFVQWIIDHDKNQLFKFSGLLSDKAQEAISRRSIDLPEQGSVILLFRDNYLTGSDAVIMILKKLEFSKHVLSILQKIPKSWRDKVYGWVSRNRYRLYDKRTYCDLPDPAHADRFV